MSVDEGGRASWFLRDFLGLLGAERMRCRLVGEFGRHSGSFDVDGVERGEHRKMQVIARG